jgi:hypothetical protein
MPAAAASRASSGHVQRASGFPLAAGGSQARALTSATARAGNFPRPARPRGIGQPRKALLAVPALPAAWAAERWPQMSGGAVRWHGQFAYVSGQLPDGAALPLMRLRYAGSASTWGFAIYRASHDDYDKSRPAQRLASRHPARSPRLRLWPLPW